MAGVMTPLMLLLVSPELVMQQQAVQVVWGLADGPQESMAIIAAGNLLQLT